MAKKKDKPQIINNIQELNLEIDYDKLAEAILKAQNAAKEESQPTEKIGFWKAVGKTIVNQESKNGKRTAMLLAEIMKAIFNFMAVIAILFVVGILVVSVQNLNWSVDVLQIVAQLFIICGFVIASLATSLIFRAIANEIGAEKDRSYITTLFFGFTSLASLVVALISLFKGVG